MEAALLLCVSLVQGVASTFRMILVRCARDWHTKTSHDDLPQETNDNHAPKHILRDDCFAIPQDEASGRINESRSHSRHNSTKALMLRDRKAIVSKHEGGFTALSTQATTTLSFRATCLPKLEERRQKAHRAADPEARSNEVTLRARPDERRDPGIVASLVPPCSFNPVHASKPFLDSDVRRNERCTLRNLSLS